jgi:ankyrin repeat protein
MKRCRSTSTNSGNLVGACLDNRLEEIRERVRVAKSCNTHEFYYTLRWASENGNVELVTELLKKRATPELEDDLCLRKASENGHGEVIRVLLRHKRVNPRSMNSYALRIASQKGYHEVVKILLSDQGADPAASDNEALTTACQRGHIEVVRLLLGDKRVSPQVEYNLPLYVASDNNRVEIVKLLLNDKRVTATACDSRAIRIAKEKNYLEIVEQLVYSSPRDPIEDDKTWLWAATQNYNNICSILLRTGKMPNLNVAEHCLLLACEANNLRLARKLILNSEISFRPSPGPLIKACQLDRKEIARLLLRDTRFISRTTGSTAVKEAMHAEHKGVISVLMTNREVNSSAPSALLVLQVRNHILSSANQQ